MAVEVYAPDGPPPVACAACRRPGTRLVRVRLRLRLGLRPRLRLRLRGRFRLRLRLRGRVGVPGTRRQ